MIDMKLWEEMIGKWAAVSRKKKRKVVYQLPERVKGRIEYFSDNCVPLLKDRKVLEIGANAGLHGYHMDKVTASYIGVEPANLISKRPGKTDYYAQAMITKKYMSKNAQFINATVSQFVGMHTFQYDTLVMCYVLYHLTDTEVELLKSHILPRCDFVIIQGRTQKRPTRHNSYKFWSYKKVESFFKNNGFECRSIWPKDKSFSIQICTKTKKGGIMAMETKKTLEDLKKREAKLVAKIKKDWTARRVTKLKKCRAEIAEMEKAKKPAVKKVPAKKAAKKVVKKAAVKRPVAKKKVIKKAAVKRAKN